MDSQSSTPPVLNTTTTVSSPNGYHFPAHRLTRMMRDGSKTPVAIVACGSFSPITYLHLRMFEMARDYLRTTTNFEVVGGYMSPVNDQYKKPGLLSAHHRIRMCTLGTEETSNWLMTDPWESLQPAYQPTAVVLDHFDNEINRGIGGVLTPEGERKHVRVMLLAGSDLIQTMSEPGVWAHQDLERILGRYGALIIERSGTDTDQALGALAQWRDNIFLVPQTIQNDVSSTKVRLFLKRGMSVRYLLPNPVVEYIEREGLYLDDNALSSSTTSINSTSVKGKGSEEKGDVENPSVPAAEPSSTAMIV